MCIKLNFFCIILICLCTFSSSSPLNYTNESEIEVDDHDNYTFLIVGGYRPEKHTLAKYLVSLRYDKTPKKHTAEYHYCGGSIISSKIILTAAHCIRDKYDRPSPPVRNILVIVGTPNMYVETQASRTYRVERTLTHPVFSHRTMRADVALLYLKEPIELIQDYVEIVPLVDEKPKHGWQCVTYGWGRIFADGPRPIEVIYVNLSLAKRSVCQEYYPMNPAVICAADPSDPAKSTWRGDSGGPLICEGKLTGVVSFGFPTDDAPSFFASVYEFREWIMQNGARPISFFMYNFVEVFVLNVISLCVINM